MPIFLEPDPSIIENHFLLDGHSNTKSKSLEDSIFLGDNLKTNTAPWKLVTPVPGCCIKTTDSEKNKVFINICQLDEIPEPKDITESELMEIWSSEEASDYRIPLSLQDPHEELDKSGVPALVYDVAINTKFFSKIQNNMIFQSFFIQVAFEGLENKYNTELEKEKYIILKNRKCLGSLKAHRIKMQSTQKPAKPLIEELSTSDKNSASVKKIEKVKDEIKYRLFENTLKNLLVGEFYLPRIINPEDIVLNMNEERLVLECKQKNYALDLFVPFKINSDDVEAVFYKEKKVLFIYMPIIK